MNNIDYDTAGKLAEDLKSTHSSIDEALVNVATLTQSVVEVCRHSDITPMQSQATMKKIADGFICLVDARQGVTGAHRQINKVQSRSNLQVVDFGCKEPGLPTIGGHKLHVVNS